MLVHILPSQLKLSQFLLNGMLALIRKSVVFTSQTHCSSWNNAQLTKSNQYKLTLLSKKPHFYILTQITSKILLILQQAMTPLEFCIGLWTKMLTNNLKLALLIAVLHYESSDPLTVASNLKNSGTSTTIKKQKNTYYTKSG